MSDCGLLLVVFCLHSMFVWIKKGICVQEFAQEGDENYWRSICNKFLSNEFLCASRQLLLKTLFAIQILVSMRKTW